MGPITEHHLMLFLIQFAMLLGACKVVGYFFEKLKQSTVTAELLVGIVLGPAILGRFAPDVHHLFFPDNYIQRSMLETIAWFGNFFLLLETGLEINFSRIWNQRGDAVKLTIADLIIPILISFLPIYFLPSEYLLDPSQRVIFALFIAAIMTISALPVAIRGMRDLNILKTDVGFLIISALTMNDIVGWVFFTIILGIFAHGSIEIGFILKLVMLTIAFTVLSLTVFKRLVDKAMTFIHEKLGAETGYKTTFIVLVGMLFGAITLKIGIHSLFGFFLAGIVLGEAKHVTEQDRHVVNRMVYSIFVPIFFANIGLHLNFIENFDWLLVFIMSVVGISARFAAAYIGSSWAKQDRVNLTTIAICHSPGGTMHIVVGMLAYSSGLISEKVFVSIIAAAIVSTIIFGPWLSWAVRRMHKDKIRFLFDREAVLLDDKSFTMEDVLHLMSKSIAKKTKLKPAELYQEIHKREEQMSTALGRGIAIPHARIEHLEHSLLLLVKTKHGIEWDSPDGSLVQLAFLILTPKDHPKAQLQILQTISIAMRNPKTASALHHYEDPKKLWSVIRTELINCSQCLILEDV